MKQSIILAIVAKKYPRSERAVRETLAENFFIRAPKLNINKYKIIIGKIKIYRRRISVDNIKNNLI
jgi:hypothetical protein